MQKANTISATIFTKPFWKTSNGPWLVMVKNASFVVVPLIR